MAESRRHLPVPVRVVLTRPDGVQTTEYAVNLSLGGVCLQVREPLDAGAVVRLDLQLPSDDAPVSLEGTVVWSMCKMEGGARFCEMGIHFEAVDPAFKERLASFTTLRGDPRR